MNKKKYAHCEKLKQQMKRITGQVNGVSKMIDDGREAMDIIQQVSAVRSALSRLAVELLKEESNSCLSAKTAKEKQNKFENIIVNLFKVT